MSEFKSTPQLGVAIPAPVRSLPAILNAKEVANLLRINRKTLYEAVQRDEIPGAFRVGRCLRFRRDAVLTWLHQPCVVSNLERNEE
jgi:excisionase family DNA binding protein